MTYPDPHAVARIRVLYEEQARCKKAQFELNVVIEKAKAELAKLESQQSDRIRERDELMRDLDLTPGNYGYEVRRDAFIQELIGQSMVNPLWCLK